tara:strand:- start:3307 stop:4185 length:879 start_codon:yes stop_codon:yes gene_type:complete
MSDPTKTNYSINYKRIIHSLSKKYLPGFLKYSIRILYLNYINAQSSSPFIINENQNPNFVSLSNNNKFIISKDAAFDFKSVFLEDHQECSAFIELAKNASVFFDVGASRGVYSNLFCKLSDSNIAIAFEGSPESCISIQKLSDLNQNNDKLQIVEKMIGDKNYTDHFSFENCGYVQIVANSSKSRIRRDVISIDSWIDRNKKVPDLIKIDVEGFEYEVLKGCKNLLEKNRPDILLELHLSYLEKRKINPEKVTDLILNSNYQFFDLFKKVVTPRQLINTFNQRTHIICSPKI